MLTNQLTGPMGMPGLHMKAFIDRYHECDSGQVESLRYVGHFAQIINNTSRSCFFKCLVLNAAKST